MNYARSVPHADRRCPTATCSRSAARARPTATALDDRPGAPRRRSGTRRRTPGPRRRPTSVRPRGTTTRRCCSPTAASCWPAAGALDGSLMTNEQTAEIYSPPYLFKGARPTITSAPGLLADGQTLQRRRLPTRPSIAKVGPDAHGLGHARLRHGPALPGARRSARSAGTLSDRRAGEPEHRAPRRYYVFLLDDNGVPVDGRDPQRRPPRRPTPRRRAGPTGLTATGALGRVTLSWTASTDNVGVTEYDVHRSTTAGFTPIGAQPRRHRDSGTTYTDAGLAPGDLLLPRGRGGRRRQRQRALGRGVRAPSPADTTPPTVSLTAPAAGATVSGTVT